MSVEKLQDAVCSSTIRIREIGMQWDQISDAEVVVVLPRRDQAFLPLTGGEGEGSDVYHLRKPCVG